MEYKDGRLELYNICPICGLKCTINKLEGYGNTEIICKEGTHNFTIHDSVLFRDKKVVFKSLNLIAEILTKTPLKSEIPVVKWRFYNDRNDLKEPIDEENINLAKNMLTYPEKFDDKIDRILMNLSFKYKYPHIDIHFDNDIRLLFCETDDNVAESKYTISLLLDLGFLKKTTTGFHLAANGLRRISELKEKEQAMKQGFIAMQFGDETTTIRTAFKQAITNCGYLYKIIDEKEHNNQIVPEIFSEIKNSKFTVVDITYPNYGAYYEAGYAQALGKEVIVCCSKDVFSTKEKNNRPHFDIAQKAMIIWEKEEELIEKLSRRIRATVG